MCLGPCCLHIHLYSQWHSVTRRGMTPRSRSAAKHFLIRKTNQWWMVTQLKFILNFLFCSADGHPGSSRRAHHVCVRKRGRESKYTLLVTDDQVNHPELSLNSAPEPTALAFNRSRDHWSLRCLFASGDGRSSKVL